jgi:hypothetical protein
MSSRAVIVFFRGEEADMPELREGEPGFATDTMKLYVGSSSGNILIGPGDVPVMMMLAGAVTELTESQQNAVLAQMAREAVAADPDIVRRAGLLGDTM